MSIYSNLVKHVDEVLSIAASHGATNVRVFGSVARGEDDLSSDVDLLVALEPGRTLFDVGGLAFDLAELLGCPVDVVTEGGLQGRFREYVLRDAVPLERVVA
jgi:predicted nucleotidyltransferase